MLQESDEGPTLIQYERFGPIKEKCVPWVSGEDEKWIVNRARKSLKNVQNPKEIDETIEYIDMDEMIKVFLDEFFHKR